MSESAKLEDDRDVAKALLDAVEAELKLLDESIAKTTMPRVREALEKRRAGLVTDVERARTAWETADIAYRALLAASPIPAPFLFGDVNGETTHDSNDQTGESSPFARMPHSVARKRNPVEDSSEEEPPRTDAIVKPPPASEDSSQDTLEVVTPKASTDSREDSQRLLVWVRSVEGDPVTPRSWILPGPSLASVTQGSEEIVKLAKAIRSAPGAVQVKDLPALSGVPLEKTLITIRRMVELKLVEIT
jgi:hypothetical protein